MTAPDLKPIRGRQAAASEAGGLRRPGKPFGKSRRGVAMGFSELRLRQTQSGVEIGPTEIGSGELGVAPA